MGRGRGLASASVKPNGVREGATGQRKAKRGEGGSWPVRKGKRGREIWLNRERERRSSGSPLPAVSLYARRLRRRPGNGGGGSVVVGEVGRPGQAAKSRPPSRP